MKQTNEQAKASHDIPPVNKSHQWTSLSHNKVITHTDDKSLNHEHVITQTNKHLTTMNMS